MRVDFDTPTPADPVAPCRKVFRGQEDSANSFLVAANRPLEVDPFARSRVLERTAEEPVGQIKL